MTKNHLIFLIIYIFSVGVQASQAVSEAEVQVVYDPALNIESEREVGQTMISKSRLATYPVILIESDFSDFIKTSIWTNSYSGTISIKKGVLKKYANNQDGVFYVDRNATLKFFAGTVPCDGSNCIAGVFIPNNTSKPATIFRMDGGDYLFGASQIEFKHSKEDVWSAGNFRRELVYGGVSQKTISISYREFLDGTARPAFSQDLKYDLTEGDVIGYRGARFQILKAGNTSIRYKVLNQLD
jgi:hypothetical protein